MSSMEELLMGLGGKGRGGARGAEAARVMESLLSGARQPSGGTRLLVTHVDLQEKSVAKGGRQRKVLSAVKNAPFAVKVALRPSATGGVRSLQQVALDLVLFYDGHEEGDYKAVDFVKEKPLQWKVSKDSSPLQASLLVRLKVLTSHHEGSLFRVGVVALDRDTGFPTVPPLRAFSAPIKVISKIEPHVKRNVTRKRMLNDMLVELVTKIDRQQEANDSLLRSYVAATRGMPHAQQPTAALTAQEELIGGGKSSTGSVEVGPHATLAQEGATPAVGKVVETQGIEEVAQRQPQENDPWAALQSQFTAGPATGAVQQRDSGRGGEGNSGLAGASGDSGRAFDIAFERFLSVFGAMPQEEKAAKLRRFVRAAQERQTASIAALVQCLAQERDRVAGQASGSSCVCRVCPYQKELSRIDDFYKDFLGNHDEFPTI